MNTDGSTQITWHRITWQVILSCVHCKASFSFTLWIQIIEAKLVCPYCGRVDMANVSVKMAKAEHDQMNPLGVKP